MFDVLHACYYQKKRVTELFVTVVIVGMHGPGHLQIIRPFVKMLILFGSCPVSFAARIRYLSLETAKKSLDKYAMHTYG